MSDHYLERQGLEDGRLGYRCVAWGQTWTREPSSGCPGVPVYGSWDRAQWLKDAQAAGYGV